jgi:phytoene desaturase
MIDMSRDVVVVGAGPGGLAAAMLLSHAGARVRVFERQDQVGGRTSTNQANGYRFDLGPTFFLYPQILTEIFSACGLHLDDAVDLKRLDPHYHLHFEGSDTLLARPNLEHMEQETSRISPVDAGGFTRFMSDNRKKFASFAPVLQKSFASPLSLVDPKLLSLLPYFRPRKSVERDLRSFFQDERLRLACAFQSKYLGMSPFTCPSIFTILSFLEYEYGIFHPAGGCGMVSEAMARAAERLGATIHLAEPVTEIQFEGKRARQVVTPTGSYPCDALVINADFAHAMQTLVPNTLLKKWTDEALENKRYSCSTFMLYLGVKRRFPDLQHHNIFLSNVYRENLTDIERDHRLSDNPSFYVCNPVATDPSMAPEGKSALYILVPVTHVHENIDWQSQTQRYRDLVLKQLAKIGMTDVESDIEYERVLSPSAWEDQYGVYKGAVFNLAHNLGQMLFLRPQNRFRELEGVYLVGGGTHPGSGLPVIYESARISARLAAEDLGL